MKRILTNLPVYFVAGFVLALYPPIRENFLLGTIVLGCLIAIYAFFAHQKNAQDNNELQNAGDNCYFLGFVFTLAIVAISLGSIDLDPESESTLDTRILLHSVATALATSIVGMIARYILINNIKLAEDKLETQINKFADQATHSENATRRLNDAVEGLAVRADKMDESLTTAALAARHYATKLDEAATDASLSLNREAGLLFEKLSNKITEALAETHFDKIRTDLQSAVKVHAESAKTVNNLMQQTLRKIEHVAVAANDNADKLHKSVSLIQTSTSEQQIQKITSAINALDDQITKLRDSLAQTKEVQIKALSDTNAEVNVMHAQIRNEFKQFLEMLQADIDAAAKLKEDYREAFSKAADQAIEETHKLYASLITGAEAALANTAETNKTASLSDQSKTDS